MTHVDWHPYPEEKPDPYFTCLVTIHLPHKNIVGCDYMTPHNGWWKNNDNEVIAWAELPEPYRPEAKNETHE